MKCPKCGYLGFEATDRCRNCGYDFSLVAAPPASELPLRSSGSDVVMVDLDLRGGASEADDGSEPGDPRLVLDTSADASAAPISPSPASALADRHRAHAPDDVEPADELPLFAPRPAGPPLAVRRPGTDVPRARRTTTTRPARLDTPSLPLVPERTETAVPARPAPRELTARPAVAGIGGRLAAGLIDATLLGSIDVVVLWLTMRIAGLQLTPEDLAVIRPLPMAGFFLVLAFLYLVGFTVGGGKTVGKMAMGIRVVGDDEQGVDLTGAVVRATGSLVSVCTLGLLFLPVFFTTDRRTVYDRLAGTWVVVG